MSLQNFDFYMFIGTKLFVGGTNKFPVPKPYYDPFICFEKLSTTFGQK